MALSTKKELVRKWERASLKDSVVFSWIVSEHQDVCLQLLQLILPKLQIISVHDVKGEYTQKESTAFHGVRFDVYAEDEQGKMYDIEMQVIDKHDLGKRIAYYQSNLVRHALLAGQSYSDKVDTYVIFVCNFDYGGAKLPVYTTRVILSENGKLIDTGEHNIILNAKAPDLSGISQGLAAFLRYVDTSVATDSFTQKLDEYIAELKRDSEKRLGYMELEQEIVAREEYAKKKALEEEREKIVKNMLNEGYTKEQIIDLMPKLTGMTQNDVVALYDKLCVK